MKLTHFFMALTETTPLPLGFKAPDFLLLNVRTNAFQCLEDLRGQKLTVVMFICNHCPYVVHVRQELIRLVNDYSGKGVGFIAISANDPVKYPADAPDKMRALADELNFPFPYLFDEDQSVAMAYHAACTPDFNVFDAAMRCVYRGRFDASSPGNDLPVTGTDLRSALDAALQGDGPLNEQWPSLGCNIKWR